MVEIFRRQVQRTSVEADHLLYQPLHRVAIVDDNVAERRQIGRPSVGAAEAPIGQHVWMVARQVARNKQRFVEIWLCDGLDGRRAQRIALHWQVADIVFVEFDLELLFKRPRMETRDLSKNFAYLPGGDSVIDDEVETDLGQRKPKFFSRTVNCPESTGQVRAKVDDRNDFPVSHLTLLPARRTIAPRKHRGRAPRQV